MWAAIAAAAPAILDYFKSKGQQGGYGDIASQIPDIEKEIRAAGSQAEGRLQPYAGAGTTALPLFQSALSQGRDPSELMDNFMSTYKQSPYAKYQTDEAQRAAENIGVAGGDVGSGAQQRALEQHAQQLASGDEQKYIGNLMGVRQQYMGGLEDQIRGGQTAATTQGQWGMLTSQEISNLMSQMATAQAKGDAAGSSGLGSLLSGGLSAGAGYLSSRLAV